MTSQLWRSTQYWLVNLIMEMSLSTEVRYVLVIDCLRYVAATFIACCKEEEGTGEGSEFFSIN